MKLVTVADHDSREPTRESGSALLMSLFVVIITAGIVTTGVMSERANRKRVDTEFAVNAQAFQFARSGLTEALSWLRRQSVQPVAEFNPIIDLEADPPILDTDDPEIGLVREFNITGNVWGRYEVWKQWDDDPDETRLAWRKQLQAVDVSRKRGKGAAGTAWLLRSVAYVFVRREESAAYDEAPNQILAIVALESECMRRSIAPPGEAAISATRGSNVHVNTYGRIVGDSGAGIYYPQGTGTPTTGPKKDNRVTGNPGLAPAPSVDLSTEAVFGMSPSDLVASADVHARSAADIPSPIPDMSLVAIEAASVKFDYSKPLKGTGIVYIKGNVTISPGSNSSFRGMLYVDGKLTVRQPSDIEGAVVCLGNMTVQGSSDYATITYNEEILNALRQEMGQYELLGVTRYVHGEN